MRNFSMFVSVWSVIIGAYLLLFTSKGVIVICIACGSGWSNFLGVLSIVVGSIGIARYYNTRPIAVNQQ